MVDEPRSKASQAIETSHPHIILDEVEAVQHKQHWASSNPFC